MDGYIKWVNGLPKVVKIILAIFPIFYFLYRLFACIMAKDFGDKFVFMIVVAIIGPLSIVYDLISVIKFEKPASCWTFDDKVVDAKAEDKKEEKPEGK